MDLVLTPSCDSYSCSQHVSRSALLSSLWVYITNSYLERRYCTTAHTIALIAGQTTHDCFLLPKQTLVTSGRHHILFSY